MFKFFIGILVGCFITYNYIIPNQEYTKLLDDANQYLLTLIQSIETQLQNNVNNK